MLHGAGIFPNMYPKDHPVMQANIYIKIYIYMCVIIVIIKIINVYI